MKKWDVHEVIEKGTDFSPEQFIQTLLAKRGLKTPKEITHFLTPPDPVMLKPQEVGIDAKSLKVALPRIKKAIDKKESIVVYADYDADGISAGAALWETLWGMGARVMPYIPHRADEGYGLSQRGIDNVRELHDPSLIITVDHGITAWEKVAYAKSLGIEVIVTDHHVKPEKLPDCTIVHTTDLCGSGVSWFVAKELLGDDHAKAHDLLALAAIGTIADLVPLIGPNRSIVKYGLDAMKKTPRVGINALIEEAGIDKKNIEPYHVSHMLAPRINAMGRIEHALDALRLLCTKSVDKAGILAGQLGVTNKQRQQMTEDFTSHALHGLSAYVKDGTMKKLLVVHDVSYNQGVIGLVAGRLVEAYYRPTIVLSVGDEYSKASARSVSGFNIIEAIRSAGDLLVDAGGHPMAAGFTVLTKNLEKLQKHLEKLGEATLTEDMLTRKLSIDAQLPLAFVTATLWKAIQTLQPFGIGNWEPVFASKNIYAQNVRVIGSTKKHLKLSLFDPEDKTKLDAVAFNMADMASKIDVKSQIDVAYTIDINEWNGTRNLQAKVKDIQFVNAQ